MQRVLAQAIGQVIGATLAALPLLARFNGLYLQDATTIALPQALAAHWPGAGGNGPQAALKV